MPCCWEPWMSVQDLASSHPTVAEIFQPGNMSGKWWTSWPGSFYYLTCLIDNPSTDNFSCIITRIIFTYSGFITHQRLRSLNAETNVVSALNEVEKRGWNMKLRSTSSTWQQWERSLRRAAVHQTGPCCFSWRWTGGYICQHQARVTLLPSALALESQLSQASCPDHGTKLIRLWGVWTKAKQCRWHEIYHV